MSKFLVRSVAAAAVLAGCAGLASAQTTVVFQPDPCVISLSPSYTASPNGAFQADIPASAIACPAPVNFNVVDFPAFSPMFVTALGASGPTLRWATDTIYNPVTNELETSQVLRLVGSYAADSSTFTAVNPADFSVNSFYIASAGLNYRLVLAQPFTVVNAIDAAPACTVNLDSTYSYTWNQEGYFIVPDSVVSCQGFTFNSRDYSLYMNLDSKLIGQGLLDTVERRVFSAATNTFTTVNELHLTSDRGGARVPAEHREMSRSPVSTGNWIFGRFSQSTEGAYVIERTAAPGSLGQRQYKATLAASFAIKRATDLSVKVKHNGARKISISINADRNASFQNTVAPTYRRQVVLPKTPADHAVVKRGNKVIQKVELSPFGFARTTIPDVRGVNNYSVTMVATDDNFAKTVAFKG